MPSLGTKQMKSSVNTNCIQLAPESGGVPSVCDADDVRTSSSESKDAKQGLAIPGGKAVLHELMVGHEKAEGGVPVDCTSVTRSIDSNEGSVRNETSAQEGTFLEQVNFGKEAAAARSTAEDVTTKQDMTTKERACRRTTNMIIEGCTGRKEGAAQEERKWNETLDSGSVCTPLALTRRWDETAQLENAQISTETLTGNETYSSKREEVRTGEQSVPCKDMPSLLEDITLRGENPKAAENLEASGAKCKWGKTGKKEDLVEMEDNKEEMESEGSWDQDFESGRFAEEEFVGAVGAESPAETEIVASQDRDVAHKEENEVAVDFEGAKLPCDFEAAGNEEASAVDYLSSRIIDRGSVNQSGVVEENRSDRSEIAGSHEVELVVESTRNEKKSRISLGQLDDVEGSERGEVVCIESNIKGKRMQPSCQTSPRVCEEIIDVESFDNEDRKSSVGVLQGWSSEKPIDVDTLSPVFVSNRPKRRKFCFDESDDECTITGTVIPVISESQLNAAEAATFTRSHLKDSNGVDEDPAVVIDKLFGKLSCPVCMRNFRRPTAQLSSASPNQGDDNLSPSIETESYVRSVPFTNASTSAACFAVAPVSTVSSSISAVLPSPVSAFSSSSAGRCRSLESGPSYCSSSVYPSSSAYPPSSSSTIASSSLAFLPHSFGLEADGMSASLSVPNSMFESSSSLLPATSSCRSAAALRSFLSASDGISLSSFSRIQSPNQDKATEASEPAKRQGRTRVYAEKKDDSDANRTDSLAVTRCGHVFCKACITESIRSTKKCPLCRKNLKPNQWYPLFL